MQYSFFQGMQPGMQNLTRSLLGASMGRQQARDTELAALGTADLKEAQAEQARLNSQLLGERLKRTQNRGADFETAGASLAGVDVPQYRDFGQYRQTGQMPSLTGETAEVGPIQPKYQWTPEQVARMDRTRALLGLAGQQDDVNPKTLVDSLGGLTGQDTTRTILDEIRAGRTNLASALNQGMKPGTQIKVYEQRPDGAVFAPGEGQVDATNPMAKATLEQRGADVKLKGAQAASAQAQGQAALIRANKAGAGGGRVGAGGKAPIGWRFTSDGESLEPIPGGPKDPKSAQLPTQALKMIQGDLDAIGAASGIAADLDAVGQQIESGALQLGPVSNVVGQARNMVGMSNENSRNLASFKATLERLRNESLRLNKGVQTEGDAIRAWNELVSSINDPQVVTQRLAEIRALNERAVQQRKMNIDNVRMNYGAAPMDTSGYEQQPATIGRGGSGSWDGTERRAQPAKAGALSPQEQAELDALRSRFGKKP